MTIHMDPVEVDNATVNHYRHMAEQVIAELHQNLSLHDFSAGVRRKHQSFDF